MASGAVKVKGRNNGAAGRDYYEIRQLNLHSSGSSRSAIQPGENLVIGIFIILAVNFLAANWQKVTVFAVLLLAACVLLRKSGAILSLFKKNL